MRLGVAVLITYIATETHGFYLFNFFEIMNLSPAAPPPNKDITAVEGPTVRGQKQTALLFGDKTPVISTNSSFFAYIGDTIFTSSDYTFTTYFKVTGTPTAQKKEWIFFTMKKSLSDTYVYYSIGFDFKRDGSVIEGEKLNSGKIEQTLFINQRTYLDRTTHSSFISLKNSIVFDQWMLLMVRIQVDKFIVSIDCNEIGVGTLTQGQTERFAFGGVMTFAQSATEDILDAGKINPEGRFVGALHDPMIINGESAFYFFSPCDADFGVQKIPSEPLPNEYNPVKFDKFVDITGENISPIRIFCKEEDGTLHYSGTRWTKKCYSYDCINGETKATYTCKSCTDPVTNNVYLSGQTWIDSQNACLENYCHGYNTLNPEIDVTNIICKTLSCDSYGSMGSAKPSNQCCDKCWSDSCPDDQEYYKGCQRKCTDGADFTCSEETNGCWCPKGQALDENNKCIPVNQCMCKVGQKMYLPGQAVVRSACSTCVCSSGSMACFKSCFY